MEQQTCGTGLAEHAVLPSRIGALVTALADVLDNHVAALDVNDPGTVPERDVYLKLVGEQREIAHRLELTATEMAAQRELPMGRHDMDVMSSPTALRAFERYVDAEQELLSLLRESSAQDQQMLGEMRKAGLGDAE